MPRPKTSRRAFLSRVTGAAKRVAGAVKREATTYRPIRGPRAISRRQAITRILAGAAATTGAYLGARKIAERIPFWTRASKRYLLTMHFAEHPQGAPLPKPIFEEIEKAKQRGEPFHVFFEEDAAGTHAEYYEKIKLYEETAKVYRKMYEKLRDNNFRHEDAILYLVDTLSERTGLPKHKIELESRLALEGIKRVPIEVHSEELAKKIITSDYTISALNIVSKQMIYRGEPILSLQTIILEAFQDISSTNRLREKSFNDIEERFSVVITYFPELRDLRQVRAIGFLGAGHRTFYLNFNNPKSRVGISETRTINRSLLEYSGLTSDPRGIPTLRQSRLTVLSTYLDPLIENLRKKGDNVTANRLFRNALRVTQSDFKQLNELTKGIPGIQDRSVFIADWVLSKS